MLQPNERRRLAAEQAVTRKFRTFLDCTRSCRKYAEKKGLDLTFSDDFVSRYINAAYNLSMPRLKVLAAVLGITNYRDLDEIFIAPEDRGKGYPWVGENGTTANDIKLNTKTEPWE